MILYNILYYINTIYAIEYIILYLYLIYKMKKAKEYILFSNVWYLFKIKKKLYFIPIFSTKRI